MSWLMTEALEEFLAEAGEFLRADRARNTVLLTVAETLRTWPERYREAGQAAPVFGWWSAPGAGVSAAFMQTPPFPALLTAMTDEAAAALALELADAGRAISGVNATPEAGQAFAA